MAIPLRAMLLRRLGPQVKKMCKPENERKQGASSRDSGSTILVLILPTTSSMELSAYSLPHCPAVGAATSMHVLSGVSATLAENSPMACCWAKFSNGFCAPPPPALCSGAPKWAMQVRSQGSGLGARGPKPPVPRGVTQLWGDCLDRLFNHFPTPPVHSTLAACRAPCRAQWPSALQFIQ